MPKPKKSRRKLLKPLDKLSDKQRQTRTDDAPPGESVKLGAISAAEVSPTNPEVLYPVLLAKAVNPERPRRGRPTTPNNFFEGGRNHWHSFFERYWHEIGWPLLEIRRRRTATMEEIRNIFEPLRGRPNSYGADCFLRGSPQPVEGKELRKNWKRASKLHHETQRMRSQRREEEFSCAQAENALKVAGEQERDEIEAEANKRKGSLQELIESLQRAETENKELDTKVRHQETYVYCSQLLDYLCKGKYAVKPSVLANAFAGAPQTGWRQSLARCAKMPKSSSSPQHPYGIFQAISRIWKRRSKYTQHLLIELFRAEVPKLRKKDGETFSYLSEGWRDFHKAVEECSKAGHSDEFMPYALTQTFLKYQSRSKTQADQIMDELEKLTPKSHTKT